MKKIYITLLFIALIASAVSLRAQCSGCTMNITGFDAANHIISSGQTMCISPTGTVTGLITVASGGTLCNSGKIGSTNVWIAGGTLKNYGTVDTYSVLVSNGGSFTNYSSALIDSLLITNANSSYINNGTHIGTAFTTSDQAGTFNAGSITVYDMWDSVATLSNTGSIYINRDFGHAYSSTISNMGNITVARDFANSYGSIFNNNKYMKIMRDFYNSVNSVFNTNCMVAVERDWYNSANVYGPSPGFCGGFNIAGSSYNTGVIGSSLSPIDICDAGHPALGLDGPGGTIDATTTYCSCNNACSMITAVKELKGLAIAIAVYPNPAASAITVKLTAKESEALVIEVRDMMGKTVFTQNFVALMGENDMKLNVSSLAAGTYILNVTNSQQQQSRQLFSVSK